MFIKLEEFALRWRRGGILILFSLLVVASVWKLGQPVIWNDEADTIFLAKSIATSGIPKAYDGKNVLVYENCSQLGAGLVSKKIPWAQYYVAYFSQQLFGTTTAGMRVLFALIGALAFFPLGTILRRRVAYPWLVSALLLLQPQVLMYHRNARYFSLLTLEVVVMLWALLELKDRPRLRNAVLALCSALLFHTHPLSAGCTVLGLTLFAFFRHREKGLADLPWIWFGLLAWAVWFVRIPGIAGSQPLAFEVLLQTPGLWISKVFVRLWAHFYDLDYIGSLPMVFWCAILVFAGIARRSWFREFWGDPLVEAIMWIAACLILGVSVEKGFEIGKHGAVLRYMPQLSLLLPILFVVSLKKLHLQRREAGVAILGAMLLSNLLSASVWFRGTPWSWWGPVYREIASTYPDSLAIAMEKLRELKRDHPEPLVAVSPAYMDAVFMVYMSDEVLIRPILKPESGCAKAVEEAVGPVVFRRFNEAAQFTLYLKKEEGVSPASQGVPFPLHHEKPDYGRPELTRHVFSSAEPVAMGRIVR